MKIDNFTQISKMGFPRTEEGQMEMRAYLRKVGIDPANLYQELEMSSRFVNTHRDTSYSNGPVSLHSHDYYEMIFCRTGGVEYLIGSDRYRLEKGDIVFVPPGISHRPILPEKMTVPYERDVVWFSVEFMEQIHQAFPDRDWKAYRITGPVRTAGSRWDFLGELFRRGVEEEEQKRPGWEVAVMGNTMTILANLNRAVLERTAATMHAEKPELLDRIAAYIELHYASHITIVDLAKTFYVSNSTISHQFKQKMGVSIYRYITQRRLIAAKRLIAEKVPMEEISRRVGFVDYSTFYRAFKQEYGISPRQYLNL